jgi:hypothetical protein
MISRIFGITLLASLLGCAAPSVTGDPPSPGTAWENSPWASTSGVVDATGTAQATQPWTHYRLPGKTPTTFTYARTEDRDSIMVTAVSSASMLRRKVNVSPADLGAVQFSWKVPDLIATADMSHRDFDDSPVRIVLAFDGDRSVFSPKNATLNELSRLITGEEMPYAVLMYVWSKQRPVGSIIHSPRTDRVRKLVVQSGPEHLHQWLDYQRNMKVDFEHVFGEPPGTLVGIGVMTDTDNTRTTAQAWYGPLQVMPATWRTLATKIQSVVPIK